MSAIKRGKERSRQQVVKRLEKSFNIDSGEWEQKHLRNYIRYLGHENGLHVNAMWTGKTKGSARNFLKYCTEADEDPKELMELVIKNWPKFVEGAIKSIATGKVIRFSRSFEFDEFFKFRKEILDWVRHGGAGRSGKEYIVKEIDWRK